MHNIRNGAIRWQIPDFISEAIVMFALSLSICKMYVTNILKCQKFWPSKRRLRSRRMGFVSFETNIDDFFPIILATWEHTSMQTGYTLHTHTHRDRVMTIGKICKPDLPKTWRTYFTQIGNVIFQRDATKYRFAIFEPGSWL